MERRITEAEPLWLRFREKADHQIDALDVIVVEAPDFVGPLRVFGRHQLLEAPRRFEMDQAAELVVARHTKLAHAQDVGGRQVDHDAVRAPEGLEEARIVMQGERARIRRAKGIEEIAEGHALQQGIGAAIRHLVELARLDEVIVCGRAETVVVGNERVHAVDGGRTLRCASRER